MRDMASNDASMRVLAAPLDVSALIELSHFFADAAKRKGATSTELTGLVNQVVALYHLGGESLVVSAGGCGLTAVPPCHVHLTKLEPRSPLGHPPRTRRTVRRNSMPAIVSLNLNLNESQHVLFEITTDAVESPAPRNRIGIVRKSSSPESPRGNQPPPADLVASITKRNMFGIGRNSFSPESSRGNQSPPAGRVASTRAPSFFKKRPPQILQIDTTETNQADPVQEETVSVGEGLIREDSGSLLAGQVRQIICERADDARRIVRDRSAAPFTPASVRDRNSFTPHSGAGSSVDALPSPQTCGALDSPACPPHLGWAPPAAGDMPLQGLLPKLMRRPSQRLDERLFTLATATAIEPITDEAPAPTQDDTIPIRPPPSAGNTSLEVELMRRLSTLARAGSPSPAHDAVTKRGGLSPAVSFTSQSSFGAPPTPQRDWNEAMDSPLYTRQSPAASPTILRAWARAGAITETPKAFRRKLSGFSTGSAFSDAGSSTAKWSGSPLVSSLDLVLSPMRFSPDEAPDSPCWM